jgi:hypothetical protein
VLVDQAANGTWVNNHKLVKGTRVPLAHNDIITILFDEHDKPLLQYRFTLLFDSGGHDMEAGVGVGGGVRDMGSSEHKPHHKRVAGNRTDENSFQRRQRSKLVQRNGGLVDAGGGEPGEADHKVGNEEDGATNKEHAPPDWLTQNAVTLSAGLVLFGARFCCCPFVC